MASSGTGDPWTGPADTCLPTPTGPGGPSPGSGWPYPSLAQTCDDCCDPECEPCPPPESSEGAHQDNPGGAGDGAMAPATPDDEAADECDGGADEEAKDLDSNGDEPDQVQVPGGGGGAGSAGNPLQGLIPQVVDEAGFDGGAPLGGGGGVMGAGAGGMGGGLSHTRTYRSRLTKNNTGVNGNSWVVKELSYLTFPGKGRGEGDSPEIDLVAGRDAAYFEQESGGGYRGKFGAKTTLEHDGDEFVLGFANGSKNIYYDNGASQPAALVGQLKKKVDPDGNETVFSYDAANGHRLEKQERTSADGTEKYGLYYRYGSGGLHSGMLESVELRKQTDSAVTPIRRTDYAYHTGNDAAGSLNDLKTATVCQYDSDAETWSEVNRSYYRYYKAGESGGFEHGLKLVLRPEAYRQMMEAGKDPEDPATGDAEIEEYASSFLTYDENRRVEDEKTDGGALERSYQWFFSDPSASVNWHSESIKTRAEDGVEIIRYRNEVGQTLLKIFKDGTDEWYDYYEYDSENRLVLHAYPSAVAGVNDPGLNQDLEVTLNAGSGRIKLYEYYEPAGGGGGGSSSGGGGGAEPEGYLYRVRVKEGENGTPVTLREYEYVERSVDGRSIYKVAERVVYRDESGGGSQPATTSQTYEWYADSFQVKQRTTFLPVVPVSENGDGVQYSSVVIKNSHGQPTWSKDARGFINYQEYDGQSGALVKRIRDVDTTLMAEVPVGWSTPADGGLHLVTDYENDDQKRVTLELGPPHTVDLDGEAVEVRRARYWVYRDDLKQTWTARGYLAEGGYRTIGPVSITRSDDGGLTTDAVQASSAEVGGRLSALDRFEQRLWTRWVHFDYDVQKHLVNNRSYVKIPESGRTLEENPVGGFKDENYHETRYGYDALQRPNRTVSPGGTITRTVYDSRGLMTEVWVGTDDTGATDSDPSGGGAAGNDMRQVLGNDYDGGQAGGDSNLTEATLPVDDTAGNDRVIAYRYDFRDRLEESEVNDGTTAFTTKHSYDNRDLITQVERYHGESPAVLMGRTKRYFDSQSRLYRSERYGVDPSTGSVGNALIDQSWYDAVGNVIKSSPAETGAFTKTVYDGLDRRSESYLAYNTGTATNDNDVSDDIVLEQRAFDYDGESNLILSTAWERFHDSTGKGALNGPDGSQPKARRRFLVRWQDAIGREIAIADYGTHGANAFVRPDLVPERSDTVLVTTTHYKDTGEANNSIDPEGIENRWDNDHLGRQIRVIENYDPQAGESDHGANRTTEFRYAPDGGMSELILKNAVTGDQVTRWVYGTTLADSAVARTDLVRAKIYPEADDDSDPLADGIDGEYERIEYAYNRQGQATKMTDPNGTEHEYDYDKLGRPTADRVTNFASHIDQAVKRIERAYEVRGMLETVTSYDAESAGNVVNEVKFEYDDFGNPAKDQQAHGGAVGAGTPEVGYAYADGSDNQTRRTAITYPDGRVLDYQYGASDGENDVLSRVEDLKINGESTAAVAYTYAGIARYVKIGYPEPDVELTYLKEASQPVGDAGDQYTGFDRFGRTVDMNWKESGGTAEKDRFQWGYDRASNRTWRRNVVAGSGHDDHYGYDGLYQVTGRQQGTLNLNQTAIGGVPAEDESFDYDPTGNWEGYQRDEDGATVLDQSRVNNRDNQITQFDGSSAGVSYDKAGNATLMPPDASGDFDKSYTLTWDGWNRLVKVADGATEVAAYAYDGLARRTTKTVGSTVTHCYYSDRWKPLEEREGSSTDAKRQYVWGSRPGHRDELIFRDRDTTGDGTLDERLYALMDYFNGTSIIDENGAVQERYEYSAFGVRTVMAPDFSERSASSFEWEFGFQGQFLDGETGYLNYGFRYYVPELGRWIKRDLIGEAGGVNIYRYGVNDGINLVDKLGLATNDPFADIKAPIKAIDQTIANVSQQMPDIMMPIIEEGVSKQLEAQDEEERDRAAMEMIKAIQNNKELNEIKDAVRGLKKARRVFARMLSKKINAYGRDRYCCEQRGGRWIPRVLCPSSICYEGKSALNASTAGGLAGGYGGIPLGAAGSLILGTLGAYLAGKEAMEECRIKMCCFE